MAGDAAVTVTLRTAEAQLRVKRAVFEATQTVFEIDIKAAAKEGSPVKTGHNRRTIDTEVTETAQGVAAKVFSQSGYGGYLELGTSKMAARPYLHPAFEQNIIKLPAEVKKRLG